jgi:hypothetical protein
MHRLVLYWLARLSDATPIPLAICILLEAGGLVNQLVNQLKSDSLGTPAQSPEPITNQLI